jgi:hypothetical protein
VAALLAADLSPLKIAVLMVDGVHVADHCCGRLGYHRGGDQGAGRVVGE